MRRPASPNIEPIQIPDDDILEMSNEDIELLCGRFSFDTNEMMNRIDRGENWSQNSFPGWATRWGHRLPTAALSGWRPIRLYVGFCNDGWRLFPAAHPKPGQLIRERLEIELPRNPVCDCICVHWQPMSPFRN